MHFSVKLNGVWVPRDRLALSCCQSDAEVMLNFHVLEVCCFLAVWDSMFCYKFFCGHILDDAVTRSEAGVVHAITVPICLFHVSEICDCTSLFISCCFMLFVSKLSCICFMQE